MNADPVELGHTEARVREWRSAASEIHVAAALLHVQLRDRFPEEKAVRSALRMAQGVRSITYSPPKGKFACRQCGARCVTARESTMHCGVMKRQEGKYGGVVRREKYKKGGMSWKEKYERVGK